VVLVIVVVLGGLAVSRPARSAGFTLAGPTRSTTIALTSDGTRLVVANRETASVSIIQVAKIQNILGFNFLVDVSPVKLGEVPRCLAAFRPQRVPVGIDQRTDIFRSAADDFIDALAQ
jgi:hypothetical protein